MYEIVLEGVTKQFPNQASPAVDHVNLDVETGGLVVLLGPSGCGKTTLLKMVNRLYEPTGGRIYIKGTEVHDLPVTELRRRIGYVIQQVGLFPHMTIAQNIAVVPRLLGWDKARIERRIDELLELVGLPLDYRTRHPRQLSGGEAQRVGIARALAADPLILLMDEPFAAIDAISRVHMQDELLKIQHKVRKTILFVTHDVEEALRLADRMVVMRAGEIVQYATPLETVTHPADEFVQQLVGTGNMLRRLSLMNVQAALAVRASVAHGRPARRSTASESAPVRPEDDLRTALSQLLKSDTESVRVVDKEGHSLGSLTFDDIYAALTDHAGKA